MAGPAMARIAMVTITVSTRAETNRVELLLVIKAGIGSGPPKSIVAIVSLPPKIDGFSSSVNREENALAEAQAANRERSHC
jgi:hypothetical protein